MYSTLTLATSDNNSCNTFSYKDLKSFMFYFHPKINHRRLAFVNKLIKSYEATTLALYTVYSTYWIIF